jgi:hypothetical protein
VAWTKYSSDASIEYWNVLYHIIRTYVISIIFHTTFI